MPVLIRMEKEDGTKEELLVPLITYTKHCEVVGVVENQVTRTGKMVINIRRGYVKVDGEKMKDLQEAQKNLKGSSLRFNGVVPVEAAASSPETAPQESAPETEEPEDRYKGPPLIRIILRMLVSGTRELIRGGNLLPGTFFRKLSGIFAGKEIQAVNAPYGWNCEADRIFTAEASREKNGEMIVCPSCGNDMKAIFRAR